MSNTTMPDRRQPQIDPDPEPCFDSTVLNHSPSDNSAPLADDQKYLLWQSAAGHTTEHHIQCEKWMRHLTPGLEQLTGRMLDELAERLGLEPLIIGVCWADDAEIKSLNSQFREQDKPTNILSFTSDEPEYNGDLVLGYEVICTEAEQMGISVADHLAHLLLHGTLHLLGYDHIDDKDADIMEQLEISLLDFVQIANPYPDKGAEE